MRRLPRAEDEVVMFIAVDGQALRVEGVVQRVTLRTAAGIDMLTGQMFRDHVRTRGEITVTLRAMDAVEPEAVDVLDGNGDIVQTIIVNEEVRRALPPSP